MRIEEAGVLIQPNKVNLLAVGSLKNGSMVLGKIVNIQDQEALLEISGDLIRAKVEGTMLPTGSVFLFKVKAGSDSRIELKIMAELTEASGKQQAALPLQQLLGQALEVQGMPATSANLKALNTLLSDLHVKFQSPPDLTAAAFLLAHDLPVTPGGYLIAWLQSGSKLRETLWNLLDQAGMINHQGLPALDQPQSELYQALLKLLFPATEGSGKFLTNTLPQDTVLSKTHNSDLDLDEDATKDTSLFKTTTSDLPLAKNLTSDSPLSRTAPPDSPLAKTLPRDSSLINDKTELGQLRLPQEELQKLGELLVNRSSWSPLPKQNEGTSTYYNVCAFLISDPGGQLRECVVHWEKTFTGVELEQSEEIIRVTIPTQNLGKVAMELRLGTQGARLNLLVGSKKVCRYLQEQESGFKAMFGAKLKLQVALEPVMEENIPGGVDLWI